MKELWGITPLQNKILHIFTKTKGSSYFYLTGGTALSTFYLKHRVSRDLDFFTGQENIVLPFTMDFKLLLKKENLKVSVNREFETFSEIIIEANREKVIIHTAQDSPFRFEEPKEIFAGLKVDGLLDIATNKILTVFSRANIRDFIDVYFIVVIDKFFDIEDLVKKAKEKDTGCDYYWLAVSFKEIEKYNYQVLELLDMKRNLNIDEMKKYFIEKSYFFLQKAKE